MYPDSFDMKNVEIAWCPGCGNFAILKIMKQALSELEIQSKNLVLVSGIGPAAKIPHYLKCNFFNGLHGRALSPATAIKAVNPALTVIVESGDGDLYGEGGNHFIHTIRRNPNITNIVHNNMVDVALEPFNPLAVAISLDASFVARAFCGDIEQTKEIFKKAIQHKGYSLVDAFQPCISFNKINTYQWFKEHTYYLEDSYNPSDRTAAFKRAIEKDKLPLGVFYVNPKPIFEENLQVYRENKEPLVKRSIDRIEKLSRVLAN